MEKVVESVEKMLRLLVIDENMNAVEIELDQWRFRGLGVKKDDVEKHTSKTALKKRIDVFLNDAVKD